MAAAQNSAFEVHSLSHQGPIREDNQDSVQLCADEIATERGYLYGLADGMGGYSHGGVASALALQTLFDTFYASPAGNPAQNLRNGMRNANLSVYQMAQRIGARMGTTLTAVHMHDRMTIAHVGDSRLYLLRKGKATCLTNDHTGVGDMVRARVLSPDKVRSHAQRSMLNRTLGMALFVQPDVSSFDLQEDDRLVLCCDGVWSVIEDDEFAALAAETDSADGLNQRLIDLALARETDDNVSVITVHIRSLKVSKPAAGRKTLLDGLPFFRNRSENRASDTD